MTLAGAAAPELKWHAYSITRFNLRFDILPNDKLEAARTGNWFLETNLVIARLRLMPDPSRT